MGRKIFQISFILLVITAFGTVFNHYLKNKISDPEDYISYIASYPQKPISVIDPIIITLPHAFDIKQFPINTPIDENIIKFKPEIEGTLYWSDTKVLEFYPDEPLNNDAEYMVMIDVNKIYKIKSKIDLFRFRLHTYKQILFISPHEFKSTDSTLVNQTFTGNVVFSDFIDIDNVYQIFKAQQQEKNLNIVFTPGNTKKSYYFSVDGIKRKQSNDTLNISWDGELIGYDLKGSELFVIPSLNSFSVKNIELQIGDTSKVLVEFTDMLYPGQVLDSLVSIKGSTVESFNVDENRLLISLKDSVVDEVFVLIDKKLKNIIQVGLNKSISRIVLPEEDKPALRLIDSTFVYTELSDNFHWEFEAIKLNAVDVQIYKIFENNVLQFLQTNSIQGINQIERVGSIVYQNTISLSDQLQFDPEQWINYQLNINDFVTEEGCIYSVLISFRKEHAVLGNKVDKKPQELPDWSKFRNAYYDSTNMNFQESPFQNSYYGFRKGISHNLYYAKLGIVGKTVADDSLYVWVNNFQTGEPVRNANITVLNFQQQVLVKASSDVNGMVRFRLSEKPCFIIAEEGKYKTYLKVEESMNSHMVNELGNSDFKAVFINSRAYWSPGNAIKLGVVYSASSNSNSDSFAEFSIYDPHKKKIYSEIKMLNASNALTFSYVLPEGSFIGDYLATFKIGDNGLSEKLTVLPKFSSHIRPEIQLISESDLYYNYALSVDGFVKNGRGLKYYVNVETNYIGAKISTKPEIQFNSLSEIPDVQTLKGIMLEEESVLIQLKKNDIYNIKEVVHLFTVRVVDDYLGFNEIETKNTIQIESEFVGVEFIENKIHYSDSLIHANFSLFDKEFKRQKENRFLKVEVCKLLNGNEGKLVMQDEVLMEYGKLNHSFKLPFIEYGAYRIKLLAANDKILTYKDIQVAWSYEYAKGNVNKASSSLLQLSNNSSQESDSLVLGIHSKVNGNLLVLVEEPDKIIYAHWHILKSGDTELFLPIIHNESSQMLVNTYFLSNGNMPEFSHLDVKSSKSTLKLYPEIFAPVEAEAETELNFKVKESNGEAINYLLTIRPKHQKSTESVDEFEYKFVSSYTNPTFFFDINGNRLVTYPSIEDAEVFNQVSGNKQSFFLPFDFLLGPFELEANSGRDHSIKLPQYIGDVLIQVYAYNSAKKVYGTTIHTLKANKPLMILASSPKQIAPDESFQLPINVFTSNLTESLADISLDDALELNITDSLSKRVLLKSNYANTTRFSIQAKRRTGIGKVDLYARDSNLSTHANVEIPITSGGLLLSQFAKKSLLENESWQTRFTPLGVKGTNSATIEYSSFQNIHLSYLLHRLVSNYNPNLEHQISSALPLLFVNELMDLSDVQQKAYEEHISQVINKLIYYQLPAGSFSIWPNGSDEDAWGSTLAGYFMIYALQNGYNINQAVYNKWLRYQRKACLTWNYRTTDDDILQAFALYVLSLANKPDIRSLVKLSERKVSDVALWLLMMTYENLDMEFSYLQKTIKANTNLNSLTSVAGNELRNKAFELLAFSNASTDEREQLILELNALLSKTHLQSLPAIAFGIVAMAESSKYYGVIEKSLSYRLNRGKEKIHESSKPYGIIDIPLGFTLTKSVEVKNTSKNKLNIGLAYSGMPFQDKRSINSQLIRARVSYLNSAGERMIKQTVQLNEQVNANIEVTLVKATSEIKNMVLIFPIANCFQLMNNENNLPENVTYMYQENNKVYCYFDLSKEGLNLDISLVANYKGKFQQPPIQIESIYNPSIKVIIPEGNIIVY